MLLFKAISPYVEYAINADYIAEFLCINKDKPELECHGQCHLTKELKKVQDEEKQASKKNMEEVQFHCINSDHFVLNIPLFSIEKAKSLYLSPFYHFSMESNTPPPRKA